MVQHLIIDGPSGIDLVLTGLEQIRKPVNLRTAGESLVFSLCGDDCGGGLLYVRLVALEAGDLEANVGYLRLSMVATGCAGGAAYLIPGGGARLRAIYDPNERIGLLEHDEPPEKDRIERR